MYVCVDMYNIVTKVFRKRFLDISRIAFIQKLRNAELVNINILSTPETHTCVCVSAGIVCLCSKVLRYVIFERYH